MAPIRRAAFGLTVLAAIGCPALAAAGCGGGSTTTVTATQPAAAPTTTAPTTTSSTTTSASGDCTGGQVFDSATHSCVEPNPSGNPCPEGEVPMADQPVCVPKNGNGPG